MKDLQTPCLATRRFQLLPPDPLPRDPLLFLSPGVRVVTGIFVTAHDRYNPTTKFIRRTHLNRRRNKEHDGCKEQHNFPITTYTTSGPGPTSQKRISGIPPETGSK